MTKEEVAEKIIQLLEDFEFEVIVQILILSQIYFIDENIEKENKLEFAYTLANLLIDSYEQYNEETTYGTSQAKH